MSTSRPLVEVWDGSEWSLERSATDAAPGWTDLRGVSCTSASFCLAVGVKSVPGQDYHTFAEIWDGEEWTASEPLDAPEYDYNVDLDGVSCTSASSCVAVGSYRIDCCSFGGLAERWDGEEWTLDEVSAPLIQKSEGGLRNVSCSGADMASTRCLATNFFSVWSWDGEEWSTLESPPGPVGGGFSLLEAVSCAGPSACTVVGSHGAGSGLIGSGVFAGTSAFGWNGSQWQVESTSSPNVEEEEIGSASFLSGVSCPTTTDCVATGAYWPGGGGEKPLAEHVSFKTTDSSATLCKAAEAEGLCSVENRYPAGTTVKGVMPTFGSQQHLYIETSMADFVCDSTLEAESTAEAGLPLGFSIEGWTVSGCTSEPNEAGLGECTATVNEPIDSGTLLWTPQEGYGENWGTFELGGEGNEALAVLCQGEYEEEHECVYEVADDFQVQAESGWPTALLDTSQNDGLNLQSGECNPEGNGLATTYLVTDPEPLYVASGVRAPSAETEAATDVEGTGATLNGTVNPGLLDTEYHFEYDTAEYKEGEEASHGTSVPVPAGTLEAGGQDVEVSEAVQGLKPGTVYHYRVLASNALGTAYGKDRSFTTHSLPTTLCKSSTASPYCAIADRYPSETSLEATSTSVSFTSTLASFSCTESAIGAKSKEVSGEPLALTLSTWSFAGCTTGGGGSCTIGTEGLPGSATVAWSKESEGAFSVPSGGEGQPYLKVKCGKVVDCTYALPGSTLQGGSTAQLAIAEGTLTKKGGTFCPATTTIKATTYTVNAPEPLYVGLAF